MRVALRCMGSVISSGAIVISSGAIVLAGVVLLTVGSTTAHLQLLSESNDLIAENTGPQSAVPNTAAPNAAVPNAAVPNATVLAMGGTNESLSPADQSAQEVQDYLTIAIDKYVEPASELGTGVAVGPYNAVAVVTPAEFAPNGTLTFDQSVLQGLLNLDNCINAVGCDFNPEVGSDAPQAGDTFVVYGFSQSSTIASFEKQVLAQRFPNGGGPDVSFVMTANGNRPNGGLLARGPEGVRIPRPLPFGGATFSGPTLTDTQYATVDVAAQYDGWADSPTNPLSFPAVLNSLMGVTFLHLGGVYQDTSLTSPGVIDQGQFGDTSYYMISTDTLPLLIPVQRIPLVGDVMADTLDPALRVLVEAAYDRSGSPGEPASWDIFYFEDPFKVTRDFLVAIPTGLDNGFEDIADVRPFRTQQPGPFGVGGPEVVFTTPPTDSGVLPEVAPQDSEQSTLVSAPGFVADESAAVDESATSDSALAPVESDADSAIQGSTVVPGSVASRNTRGTFRRSLKTAVETLTAASSSPAAATSTRSVADLRSELTSRPRIPAHHLANARRAMGLGSGVAQRDSTESANSTEGISTPQKSVRQKFAPRKSFRQEFAPRKSVSQKSASRVSASLAD